MRHVIFDIPIDDLPLETLKERISFWLREGYGHMITTPNPEFVVLAKKEPAFRVLLSLADLSLADGVGLRFAICALTEGTLKHRHTGVDMVDVLCAMAQESNRLVLLLGGEAGSAARAKDVLSLRFPTLCMETIDPGSISGDARRVEISDALIQRIQTYHPDILIVALGQGKQERFIRQLFDQLPKIPLAIGVGGAFETIAGIKPRAPRVLQQKGLEWLWRLWLEPKRFRRMFRASIVFPIMVISATLKQHIFFKALKKTLPEIWHQMTNKS